MVRLAAALLLVSCVSPGHDVPVRSGRFFVEVIGETALIRAGRPDARDPCTLGSAEDDVLVELRRAGNRTELELTYEAMPMPVFTQPGEDVQPPDRMAAVRGQIIAPWCNSPAFYWIRSFRLVH